MIAAKTFSLLPNCPRTVTKSKGEKRRGRRWGVERHAGDIEMPRCGKAPPRGFCFFFQLSQRTHARRLNNVGLLGGYMYEVRFVMRMMMRKRRKGCHILFDMEIFLKCSTLIT